MSPPEAQAAALREMEIVPPRGWRSLELGELWTHRDLVYFLTKRELQIRYRQSFFGVGWAVLQPIVLAFIVTIFIGHLLHIETGIPYPVFAVAGFVPWLFTAQAVTNSAQSLVKDAELISKVYFPRLAVPLSLSLSLIIDLAISMVVLLVMTALYGVSIESTIWLVPAFLLLGVLTTFAIGTLFAAINVKYRDIQLIVPMLVQMMFFITPVLYPGNFVTGDWQYVWAANPLVSVLEGVRWALYGTAAPLAGMVAVSVGSAIVLSIFALWYFRRTEQFFADLV